MESSTFAAIILAGGNARRMGGAVKPLLPVGGRPMLARVLAAVAEAGPRIVVGPSTLASSLPVGTLLTYEEPPGGGPLAGLAAAMSLLADRDEPGPATVGVLAGDLPFVSSATVASLRDALRGAPGAAVAVLTDPHGHRQPLLAVWRTGMLAERLRGLGDPAGRAVRELLRDVELVEVQAPIERLPSYLDCDTEAELLLANQLTDEAPRGGSPGRLL